MDKKFNNKVISRKTSEIEETLLRRAFEGKSRYTVAEMEALIAERRARVAESIESPIADQIAEIWNPELDRGVNFLNVKEAWKQEEDPVSYLEKNGQLMPMRFTDKKDPAP